MGFLFQASFPQRKASLVAVDGRMKPYMKNKLAEWGLEVFDVPPDSGLSSPVSGHPDMQMVHLQENLLVCHPRIPPAFIENLKNRGFDVFIGDRVLEKEYPLDIAYNVAIIGRIAFHNTKYTAPVLMELLRKCSIRPIHVNQGYTKCSVLPITPESLITADPSITKAAREAGMDVLNIPPQRNIHLPGMRYGFIGGTAGFIDKNTLAFAGSLEALDSQEEIKLFLKKHGICWLDTANNEICDDGGLLPLYEE